MIRKRKTTEQYPWWILMQNLQQKMSKQFNSTLKELYTMTKWPEMQWGFNIKKSINIIHHVNRMMEETHMIDPQDEVCFPYSFSYLELLAHYVMFFLEVSWQ